MALTEVTLETIECGNLLEAANAALNELRDDIILRPRLDGPRKLTVTVELVPEVVDLPHGVERAFCDMEWNIKIAPRAAESARAKNNRGRKLAWTQR